MLKIRLQLSEIFSILFLVFRSPYRLLFILCLLILDILLIANITSKKTLGFETNQSSKKVLAARSFIKITPTITRAPSPTLKPTPTPTLTPVPTKRQAPSSTPTPTSSSGETAAQGNANSSPQTTSQTLLKQVNDFRASNGLSPVTTDGYTCALATARAQEIASGFSHDGFNNRVSSHALPYPTYHYVDENIAENSDPNDVVPSWIASPGHNANMRQDTPYVCIANYGNYYAYEGWKP